jgi:hypothetical protein
VKEADSPKVIMPVAIFVSSTVMFTIVE